VDSFLETWYLLAAQAISEIGSGVLLVAGVVWLIARVGNPPADSSR
jgi:hypothetical protein